MKQIPCKQTEFSQVRMFKAKDLLCGCDMSLNSSDLIPSFIHFIFYLLTSSHRYLYNHTARAAASDWVTDNLDLMELKADRKCI